MRSHTGYLPAYAASKLMTSGDALGGIKDIFRTIVTSSQRDTALSIDEPALSKKMRAYYVTLRNKRTKQEAMHPIPVVDLRKWPQLFKDDPILFDLDLPKTQGMFPEHLNLPSYGAQAWAVTPFASQHSAARSQSGRP